MATREAGGRIRLESKEWDLVESILDDWLPVAVSNARDAISDPKFYSYEDIQRMVVNINRVCALLEVDYAYFFQTQGLRSAADRLTRWAVVRVKRGG